MECFHERLDEKGSAAAMVRASVRTCAVAPSTIQVFGVYYHLQYIHIQRHLGAG